MVKKPGRAYFFISLVAAKTPGYYRRELSGDKLEISATKVQMGSKTPPEPSLLYWHKYCLNRGQGIHLLLCEV